MTTDIEELDTFPKLLMHHAAIRGSAPAIREKQLGIWQTWTWQQFADEVRALTCALAALGLKRGEHFALVGDNRPRLYATVAAVQCLGAVPVPLYQDAVAAGAYRGAGGGVYGRADAGRRDADLAGRGRVTT